MEVKMKNEISEMKMYVWSKRMFIIEKSFSELEWIYGVVIRYDGVMVRIVGFGEDVLWCYCVLEGLLMSYGRKEVKNEIL